MPTAAFTLSRLGYLSTQRSNAASHPRARILAGEPRPMAASSAAVTGPIVMSLDGLCLRWAGMAGGYAVENHGATGVTMPHTGLAASPSERPPCPRRP